MSIDPKNKPVTNGWLGFLNSPYSVFILTFIIGIFYILTLHEGHNWGDDFSQYIHHAKNLAEGKHYLDTGYIPSNVAAFVGPYAYPPVFPILLVPVYWFYGLDLEAMKLVGIVCFCLALMLLSNLFAYQLNRLQQISIIALTGFNPVLWEARNHILSDFTFMLFCYLSLHLMLQVFHSDRNQHSDPRQPFISSCLIGTAMYLAYGTREMGIVLPCVVLVYEMISARKITSISITSIAVFSCLLFLQHHLLQGNFISLEIQNALRALAIDSGERIGFSHLAFFSIEPDRILKTIQDYRFVVGNFWRLWPSGNSEALEILNSAIFGATILMAFIGFCLRLSKEITVLEIFVAGYIAALLFVNIPATPRYVFPLFPLMLYYCVVAYSRLFTSDRFKFKTSILISYVSMTAILYGHAIYDHSREGSADVVTHPNSYAAITNGVTHPKAVEMFNFIRNNTSQSDTIVFHKPRVMALLTQRASAGDPGRKVYPAGGPERKLHPAELINRFFDAVEGDYYVDYNGGNPLRHSEPPTSRFSEVFRNTHFAIYRYSQS